MDKPDFLNQYEQILAQYEPWLSAQKFQIPSHFQKKSGEFFYELFSANQKINLTGYKTLQEYVLFHLFDTLFIADALKNWPWKKAADIGTGCGVPGMLIKFLYPDREITLVDSVKKKVDFLSQAVDKLGIKGCTPIHVRAEFLARDSTYREKFDCVLARAFASLSTSLEICAGFTKPGGRMVLPRGEEPFSLFDLNPALESLSCAMEVKTTYRLPQRKRTFQLLIFKKNDRLLEKYPRKPGQIAKRPL